MLYKFSKYNLKINEDNGLITLYNCYTGKLCRLTTDKYFSMLSKAFGHRILDEFNLFVKNGFAVPININEALNVRDQRLALLQDTNRKEQRFVIAPTMSCNLRCPYCFEKNIDNFSSITKDVKRNLILMIEKNLFPSTKTVYVTFFGGEPLLCFDTVREIGRALISKLNSKGVRLISRIITNGTLLDFDKAMILRDECNLKKVQITLDGLEENYCKRKNTTINIYQQVIKNIVEICNVINVRIRLNADKENIQDLYDLSSFLINKLNLKNKIEIYLAQLRDYARENNHMYYSDAEFAVAREKFYMYLNSLGQATQGIKPPRFNPLFCSLMQNGNFAIDPFGRLFKCEHCLGKNDMAVGNVQDGLFGLDPIIDRNINNTRCLDCNLYPVCDYGCIALNQFTGAGKCLVHANKLKQVKILCENYLNRNNL